MYESFIVVEANPAFGFALLQSERTGTIHHAEIFVNEPDGQTRLQVGDRVQGLLRGEAVTRVRLLDLAAPLRTERPN